MQVVQAIVGLLIGAAIGVAAAWGAAQGLVVERHACPDHPVLEARIADLEARIAR